MATFIDKSSLTNISDYPNSFKRGGAFPLDYFGLFNTLEAAQTYASSHATAYAGQTVVVATDDIAESWKASDGTTPLYPVKDGTDTKLYEEDTHTTLVATVADSQIASAQAGVPFQVVTGDTSVWYTKAAAATVTAYLIKKDGTLQIFASGGDAQQVLAQALAYTDTKTGEINAKIPTEATSTNQLADKSFVNSSIEAVAAYFVTKANSGKTASDGPFSTKSELDTVTSTSGNVFWRDGKAVSKSKLTKNDYTVVLADETQSSYIEGIQSVYSTWTTTAQYVGYYVNVDSVKTLVTAENKDSLSIVPGTTVPYTRVNPTTRYHYDGSTWVFQYIINNSGFTQAQWNAINSGTSSTWKASVDTDIATITGTSLPAKADKVTSATENNIPKLDANGNLVDAGIAAADIVLTSDSRLTDARTTKESLTVGTGDNAVTFNGAAHVDIIAGTNVQLTKDTNGKAVISATDTTYVHASDKTETSDLGLITKGELEKITGASTVTGSIAEAKKAGDDAQSTADTNATNITNLTTKVGDIPTGATAVTVTGYAKEEADKKMQFLGVADSMPTTATVVIGGTNKTATNGHVIIYDNEEYMFNGSTWIQFSSHAKVTALENGKVDKTTTIAGVDLQDNITKAELLTALNVADGAQVNVVEGAVDSNGDAFTITDKKIVLTSLILNGGSATQSV